LFGNKIAFDKDPVLILKWLKTMAMASPTTQEYVAKQNANK
jgi:hypothetical protein